MFRRLAAALALFLAGAVTSALLLSDRAPGLYHRARERAFDLVVPVRDLLGLDQLTRSDVPIGAHPAAHIALFFGLTVLAGVVLRRRVRPVLVAAGVFALSAVFELLQPVVSDTRGQQVDDLVANGIGVLAGLGVLLVLGRIGAFRRSRSLAW